MPSQTVQACAAHLILSIRSVKLFEWTWYFYTSCNGTVISLVIPLNLSKLCVLLVSVRVCSGTRAWLLVVIEISTFGQFATFHLTFLSGSAAAIFAILRDPAVFGVVCSSICIGQTKPGNYLPKPQLGSTFFFIAETFWHRPLYLFNTRPSCELSSYGSPVASTPSPLVIFLESVDSFIWLSGVLSVLCSVDSCASLQVLQAFHGNSARTHLTWACVHLVLTDFVSATLFSESLRLHHPFSHSVKSFNWLSWYSQLRSSSYIWIASSREWNLLRLTSYPYSRLVAV